MEYIGVIIVVILIFSLLVWFIYAFSQAGKTLEKREDSNRNKIFISKFLEKCKDESLMKEINDYKGYDFNSLPLPVFLTKNYLIIKHFGKTKVVPLNTVLWVYKKSTAVKTKLGSTYGQYSYLVLILDDGKMLNVNFYNVEQYIDDSLTEIKKFAPWGFYGYSEELQKYHRKNFDEMVSIKNNKINDK